MFEELASRFYKYGLGIIGLLAVDSWLFNTGPVSVYLPLQLFLITLALFVSPWVGQCLDYWIAGFQQTLGLMPDDFTQSNRSKYRIHSRAGFRNAAREYAKTPIAQALTNFNPVRYPSHYPLDVEFVIRYSDELGWHLDFH